MPKEWHDRHTVNKMPDEGERTFYRSIVADRKPYFMRYIYPELMKKYNEYVRNTNRNALRQFGNDVNDMLRMQYAELSDAQKDFLRYYDKRMPVGMNDCVMNRICRRFEREFDGIVAHQTASLPFDYKIMRGDATYTARQYSAIKRLDDEYNNRLKAYAAFASRERLDDDESTQALQLMNDEFQRECAVACPDRDTLCNIVLDICYTKSSTKRFAWSMCGHEIIANLLRHNGNTISFPAACEGGEVEYGGRMYTVMKKTIEVTENDRIE